MFNGIIYNQGSISKIVKRDKGLNIFVKSGLKVSSRDIGLSVACDGAVSYTHLTLPTILRV